MLSVKLQHPYPLVPVLLPFPETDNAIFTEGFPALGLLIYSGRIPTATTYSKTAGIGETIAPYLHGFVSDSLYSSLVGNYC